MTDLAAPRRRMVQDQLQGCGVRDARLLRAMERAARERFVPSNARPHVFEDRPIPVAEGVVLPQAHITAYRIEALARAPGARVLQRRGHSRASSPRSGGGSAQRALRSPPQCPRRPRWSSYRVRMRIDFERGPRVTSTPSDRVKEQRLVGHPP